ncbi:hypothetical protein ACFE04_011432 [Oxalis oulophora]
MRLFAIEKEIAAEDLIIKVQGERSNQTLRVQGCSFHALKYVFTEYEVAKTSNFGTVCRPQFHTFSTSYHCGIHQAHGVKPISGKWSQGEEFSPDAISLAKWWTDAIMLVAPPRSSTHTRKRLNESRELGKSLDEIILQKRLELYKFLELELINWNLCKFRLGLIGTWTYRLGLVEQDLNLFRPDFEEPSFEDLKFNEPIFKIPECQISKIQIPELLKILKSKILRGSRGSNLKVLSKELHSKDVQVDPQIWDHKKKGPTFSSSSRFSKSCLLEHAPHGSSSGSPSLISWSHFHGQNKSIHFSMQHNPEMAKPEKGDIQDVSIKFIMSEIFLRCPLSEGTITSPLSRHIVCGSSPLFIYGQ